MKIVVAYVSKQNFFEKIWKWHFLGQNFSTTLK